MRQLERAYRQPETAGSGSRIWKPQEQQALQEVPPSWT